MRVSDKSRGTRAQVAYYGEGDKTHASSKLW